MRLLKIFITIVLLFTLTSCTATYALNPKLEMKVRLDPLQGKLLSPNKSDDLFLILSFSGGGTRAAALSYGILEALEKIEIPPLQKVFQQKIILMSGIPFMMKSI